MAPEVISNVGNRYEFAKEVTFGTVPVSFTTLDLGHVQSITVDEDDSVEEIDSMNSGHTILDIDDDLYNLSGTIVTKCTKAALPVILEAIAGGYSDDSTDYTITSAPVSSDALSYFMKFNTTAGNIKQIAGIGFTGADFDIQQDGSVEVTMNYQAQILSSAVETLSPSTNVGDVFRGLDAVVTYNGNATILRSFSFTMDWNVDAQDGRGIEAAHVNGRRVINRIVRHNLNVSGSFESEMDDLIDTGYVDSRSNVPIVLTLSRETDNEHAFTFAATRTKTRSRDLNNDSATKIINCDFTSTDIGIIGDL